MTLTTFRSLLSLRALAPLALLALMAAPFPAPYSLVSAAHAQNQLWITQFGTQQSDVARALTPDGAGGVMVAGWTDGILGGQSAGGFDTFLARHDSAGNQLWIRQFGFEFDDRAFALAPANAGGVFIAGITRSLPFRLGDAFVARYDSAGNQLWFRHFGTGCLDWATALAPDGAGGVFVLGTTFGNLGGPSAGRTDVFLARYDGAGNQIWIRQWGDFGFDRAWALAPDGAGGVMVAVTISGYAFVGRYSAAGDRLWNHQFDEGSFVSSLAPDGAGGVILAGWTEADFGGVPTVKSDAILARLDSAGNRLWIRKFGTSASDSARALAPDGAGGVLVAGSTAGNLGGPHAGGWDAFLARYDGAGDRLWIRQFGTSEDDVASALAPDGPGGVMVAGWTDGSLGGPSAGGWDAFLARYEIDSCYPDCDFNGVLDIFDFLCFQNSFVLGEPYACECDPDPACDIFDFICFQNAFVGGCP
ncbi:MAG: hypothetical protein IH985_00055 [Planctomycetes bacterium]|nr:hypothetical protein [Planctomycetota bacterium]